VASKYLEWATHLPRVRPFYAVKSGPDRAIVTLLHQLGAGFECASKSEIDLMRSIGVPADSILYASPCKLASHLRFARDRGVLRTSFDNEPELRKIAAQHPTAQLVLRIATDHSKPICGFAKTMSDASSESDSEAEEAGWSFGAEACEAPVLIRKALELGLELVGVSIDVGSGAQDTGVFVDALNRARLAFNQMEELGVKPWLLSIGGGFAGTDASKASFAEIAAVIRPVIDELFPPHMTVISEPGGYFCAGSHTVAAMIYERREIKLPSESAEASSLPTDSASKGLRYEYYLNDGLYGSFNSILSDHAVITDDVFVIPEEGSRDSAIRPKYSSTVFGPACDGRDCIFSEVTLPLMECGEWIVFGNMGACPHAASSSYGFHQHSIIYFRM
jgi:ornithine decarboxylase